MGGSSLSSERGLALLESLLAVVVVALAGGGDLARSSGSG